MNQAGHPRPRPDSHEPPSPAAASSWPRDVMQPSLVQTLQTPRDAVYQLSQDGSYYVNPPTLRTVPVAVINESSPYWSSAWDSLDEYLSKEGQEKALKQQYKVRHSLDPDNASIRKRGKFHQDNMSKYHKIREIFGPGSDYHPNQLVAKHHLPPGGLCRKEIMYRLACKLSDLRVLQNRGTLLMDPWDFIRWRIGLKIKERQRVPGETAASFMRSLVYRLCDENRDGSNPYGDSVMREAAILAAKYQNRRGNYKALQLQPQQLQQQQQQTTTAPRRLPSSLVRTTDAGSRALPASRPMPRPQPTADQAVDEARRLKRAKRTAPPSTYQGVNAFRAQMRARAAGKASDGA